MTLQNLCILSFQANPSFILFFTLFCSAALWYILDGRILIMASLNIRPEKEIIDNQ